MKRIVSLIVAIAVIASMGIVGLPMSVSAAATPTHGMAAQTTVCYGFDAFYEGATESGIVALNSGSVVLQSVVADAPVVGLVIPVWGLAVINVDVYAYDTDLATSAAGTAVASVAGVAAQQSDQLFIMFEEAIPAGKYVVKFTVGDFASGFHLGLSNRLNSEAECDLGGAGTSFLTTAESAVIINLYYDIVGEISLSQDLVAWPYGGSVGLTTGDVSINLNGYTWSNSSTAIIVQGANLDIYGYGTVYATNDAIVVESGSVDASYITVNGDAEGCDAFFIKGGTVNITDCNLIAQNACVHNDNRSAATVNVDGGTFEAIDAFKVRNNGTINVTGLVGNYSVNIQKNCTADWGFEDAFVATEFYKVSFSDVAARTDIDATSGLSTGDWYTNAAFSEPDPGETEEFAIELWNATETVTVPAGAKLYYGFMNRGEAVELSVEGETGFVVSHNGADNSDTEGVVGPIATSGNAWGLIKFAIENTTDEEQTYTVEFTPAKGTSVNPYDMVIGDNSVVTSGSWNGLWLKWVAAEAGTLTVTMDCDKWLYNAELNGVSVTENTTHYCDDEPVVDSIEVEVAADDVFMICVNTYDPETYLNPVGTVSFIADFDAPTAEKADYEIDYDTVLQLGDNEVTLLDTAITTVYEFCPEEAGVYKFTVNDENALVGYWGGGTFYVWDQTENKTNSLEASVAEVGPSIMVGVSGVESCTITVERLGDVEEGPVVEEIMYENQATLEEFAGVDGELTYVDVVAGEHTAVLCEDGHYHLDTEDGPILYANILGGSEYGASLVEAMGYGQVNYYPDETTKIDFIEAIAEYYEVADENGFYPLTVDLVEMFQKLGESKGWYDADVLGFYLFGEEEVNAESAWLFSCAYVEADEDVPTDEPTDEPADVPETGDSSTMIFAVIAVMACAAFVATVVLKKRAR